MAEFRVDITRPYIRKIVVGGLEIDDRFPLNYVDAYLPDGTQICCGNISPEPKAGAVFTPFPHVKQVLINAIQAEINTQLGCKDDGPPAAVVMEYVGNDFTEEDDDEDD